QPALVAEAAPADGALLDGDFASACVAWLEEDLAGVMTEHALLAELVREDTAWLPTVAVPESESESEDGWAGERVDAGASSADVPEAAEGGATGEAAADGSSAAAGQGTEADAAVQSPVTGDETKVQGAGDKAATPIAAEAEAEAEAQGSLLDQFEVGSDDEAFAATATATAATATASAEPDPATVLLGGDAAPAEAVLERV
ncbi:MAG: hypothetical protein ACK40Z_15015, partial [Dietzia sp.]